MIWGCPKCKNIEVLRSEYDSVICSMCGKEFFFNFEQSRWELKVETYDEIELLELYDDES